MGNVGFFIFNFLVLILGLILGLKRRYFLSWLIGGIAYVLIIFSFFKWIPLIIPAIYFSDLIGPFTQTVIFSLTFYFIGFLFACLISKRFLSIKFKVFVFTFVLLTAGYLILSRYFYTIEAIFPYPEHIYNADFYYNYPSSDVGKIDYSFFPTSVGYITKGYTPYRLEGNSLSSLKINYYNRENKIFEKNLDEAVRKWCNGVCRESSAIGEKSGLFINDLVPLSIEDYIGIYNTFLSKNDFEKSNLYLEFEMEIKESIYKSGKYKINLIDPKILEFSAKLIKSGWTHYQGFIGLNYWLPKNVTKILISSGQEIRIDPEDSFRFLHISRPHKSRQSAIDEIFKFLGIDTSEAPKNVKIGMLGINADCYDCAPPRAVYIFRNNDDWYGVSYIAKSPEDEKLFESIIATFN